MNTLFIIALSVLPTVLLISTLYGIVKKNKRLWLISLILLIVVSLLEIALFVPIYKKSANSENHKSESEMSAIMKSHITLKDTLYVVEISKEEALKLGVSDSFYTELIGNIERGNKMIKKTLESENAVVSIVDMKTDSLLEVRKGNQKLIKK